MEKDHVDCRGLACPGPVLKAKALTDQSVPRVTIIVDNEAAKENVWRFLERQGYSVSVEKRDGCFWVMGEKKDRETRTQPPEALPREPTVKTLFLIGTDRLGSGDDLLGKKLMVNFIKSLEEMVPNLWRLIFLNSGVKLTTQGSPVLDSLHRLEDAKVSILVCGTCLMHFSLLEEKRVGETTNMMDIVTSMDLAERIVTIT